MFVSKAPALKCFKFDFVVEVDNSLSAIPIILGSKGELLVNETHTLSPSLRPILWKPYDCILIGTFFKTIFPDVLKSSISIDAVFFWLSELTTSQTLNPFYNLTISGSKTLFFIVLIILAIFFHPFILYIIIFISYIL